MNFSASARIRDVFAASLLFAAFSSPAPALAAREKPAAPTRAQVSEKQGDLKALRGRIETLRKGVAADENKRASATDRLKRVEQDISATQRRLHQLAGRRAGLQENLRELGEQSRALEARLKAQQEQLAHLLRRQYRLGNPDALRIFLSGDDPAQAARDLYYLEALGRARGRLLHENEALLKRQQTLSERTRERAEELSGVEAKQKEQHETLLAQRQERQQTIEGISARITQQKRTLGELQRDEQRLSKVIAQLSRALAARPPPKKVAAAPRGKPADEAPSRPAPELANEATPEASGSPLTQLKGQLRLPVRGTVMNRFGGTRQEGGTWKGLFIRAETGSEVKAIAAGRIVFADWMRGFGNLLIIDHGGQYLSVYGNNEALLKNNGDAVRGGEAVAAVGNSGGNPESGLYFELRHRGQALDPLKWVSLK